MSCLMNGLVLGTRSDLDGTDTAYFWLHKSVRTHS